MDVRDMFAGSGFLTYGLWHPLESLSSVGPTLNEATFGLLGPYFNPDRDIPSLEGKVILLTGGNQNHPINTSTQNIQANTARASRECRNRQRNHPPALEAQPSPNLSRRAHRKQSPRSDRINPK